MWVRGLKLVCREVYRQGWKVAPHVGAWIETYHQIQQHHQGQVAPHVGAWIETLIIKFNFMANIVAPHVGAWIESCLCTRYSIKLGGSRKSRLTR